MFGGDGTIRFRSAKRGSELEDIIEQALGRLGRVEFHKGGAFELVGARLRSGMSVTEVTGHLPRGRKDDEWVLDVNYTVRPSPACWVAVALGVVFLFLLGVLFLLIPFTTKGEV
ncbi:hypothetical protein J8F10_15960 [Gemmata sp. G18]|uniref:Uncharacterized protein n=1 Tax=Gemmata palustris TaxID=2822762 RepID=A0ABS5BSU0_9BACT|nr:hypothetical protein [Gemmata palustris]MBP3956768.1 hypothetical protein [Gemmata palustris]